MLRLASRIATQGEDTLTPWLKHINPPELRNTITALVKMIQNLVIHSPSLVIDNVAEMYAIKNQDAFSLAEFHCVMPPWKSCFVEWMYPKKWMRNGVVEDRNITASFGTVLLTPPIEAFLEIPKYRSMMAVPSRNNQIVHEWCKTAKHVTMMWSVICESGKVLQLPRYEMIVFIAGDGHGIGSLCIPLDPRLSSEDVSNYDHQMAYITWLALSLANCKNVTTHDVTETEGPSAKWIRRQKAPTIRYHVLDINPMREVLRKEGGLETNGLKKALHLCRGHFATYTAEKPLFGHVTGTFWKPQHVRGSLEQGAVVKDYRIKLPQSPTIPAE